MLCIRGSTRAENKRSSKDDWPKAGLYLTLTMHVQNGCCGHLDVACARPQKLNHILLVEYQQAYLFNILDAYSVPDFLLVSVWFFNLSCSPWHPSQGRCNVSKRDKSWSVYLMLLCRKPLNFTDRAVLALMCHLVEFTVNPPDLHETQRWVCEQ